jgi:hypothetical protein
MVVPYEPYNIWQRIFVADRELTPEEARYFLQRDFGPADHARLEYLGDRANEGTLTPAERAEYDEYIHVGDVLAILQSKARVALCRVAEVSGRG